MAKLDQKWRSLTDQNSVYDTVLIVIDKARVLNDLFKMTSKAVFVSLLLLLGFFGVCLFCRPDITVPVDWA